jgi:hypothetical protein
MGAFEFTDNVRVIAVRIEFPPGTFAATGSVAREAWSTLLWKWIVDQLEERHLLAIKSGVGPKNALFWGTEGCFVFFVSDWRKAYWVIRERLESLDLLQFCRISRGDYSEGIWWPLHPADDNPAFDPEEGSREIASKVEAANEAKQCELKLAEAKLARLQSKAPAIAGRGLIRAAKSILNSIWTFLARHRQWSHLWRRH